MNEDDFQANFWQHFEDLRHVFVKIIIIVALGMAIPFYFQNSLIDLLTYPFHQVEPEAQLALLSPIEGFMVGLRLSFWVGLIGTFPLWIIPIIKFILPGLHFHERQMLFPFLLGSFLCLGMGMACAYWFTLPFANRFFYTINSSMGVNLWSLSAYLDFTLLLLFGHAVVFECGLALLFLVHYGWIGWESMRDKRRMAVVGAFILGALITPPDIPSQLMVAIPLIGMYELCLLYARFRMLRVKEP